MTNSRRRGVAKAVMLILLALTLSSCGDKGNPKSAAKNQNQARSEVLDSDSINIIMSNVAANYSAVYQQISRTGRLNAEEKQNITRDIENLSRFFQRADQIFEHKSDAYQIGYAFVIRYLKLSAEVLREGDQIAIREHMMALREICSTCHTQDKLTRSLYQGATADQFPSLFQYAEFNYSTRNYQEAVKYYQLSLDQNRSPTELDIILPLQRILSVYLQVYDDPEKALLLIRKYQHLKAHTDYTSNEMKGWLAGVSYLQALKKSIRLPLDKAQLTEWVKQFFGGVSHVHLASQSNASQEVQRIWLRGRLYEYLDSNPPRQEVPEVLYWLSLVDQSTSYNYYFSYADLYLSQCVRKYSDLPYARDCFAEYEKYIYEHYLKNARLRDPMARYPNDIEEEYQELKKIMSKMAALEPAPPGSKSP